MVQRPILQGFRLVTSTTPTNTHTSYYDRQPSPSTPLTTPDPTSSSPSSYSSSSTFVSSLTDRGDVLFVTGHKDPTTKKNIILWEDILIPFRGAKYIRQGATVVPFLKGHDFKSLEPLRIALVPNVILEVVVAESQTAGVEGQVNKLSAGMNSETASRKTPIAHETTSTTTNKVFESDKVVIKTEPQEIEYMLIDDVVDMHVKEAPRNYEVVAPKVVKAVEREMVKAKEKEKEKAPNPSNNHNNFNNSTAASAPLSKNANSKNANSKNANSNNSSTLNNITSSSNDTDISSDNSSGTINSTPNNSNNSSSDIINNTSNNDKVNSNNNNDDKKQEQDEDVVEAERELMAAERGDAEAQFRVGSMYRRGKGLPQSFTKSRKWYLRAAEQKHRNAQFQLGVLLENGDHNLAKDLVTAVDWYHKAAELGHPEAQFRLGVLYGKGMGVSLDGTKALGWYTRAAVQGVELAQLAVGIHYYKGRVGVMSERGMALGWFTKAAEQGNADAQYLIGLIYYIGNNGERRNCTRAMQWFLNAATNERGPHSGAQYSIGLLYKNGQGVVQDYTVAKEWFLKVTTAVPCKDEKEKAQAYFIIGQLYYDGGPGITQDYSEAMSWFVKAANMGHVESHYYAGRCFELGHPNGERKESAMAWYRLAADRGHRLAQDKVKPPTRTRVLKRKQTAAAANGAKKRKATATTDAGTSAKK